MSNLNRTLFVSPASAAYGSERSMLALLKVRRFEAEVVCPGGGNLERELMKMGIKTHLLEFNRYSLRQNPLWHLGFYRRFKHILQIRKPKVIVINLDGNTPLVSLAAVQAGIPFIRFCRFEFKPPSHRIDRWCWLKSRAVICPSEVVKQQVISWAPPEFSCRVHCFYESCSKRNVDDNEIAAFRRRFGLGEDRIIGYLGRLHRGKCIETAIKALAVVREKLRNARLLIIGEGDGSPNERAYKEELRHLADTLGIGESVIFTGYFPSEIIPAVIATFDVCVLPSESESFGMVLMESWAQGVPTVASDIGGCREIVLASGGGWLAPVRNVEAFADRILKLLLNPVIAAEIGGKGKSWVHQNCNPETYASRFESVINKLIQTAP